MPLHLRHERWRYFATVLLNHAGDVNLAIPEFAEFESARLRFRKTPSCLAKHARRFRGFIPCKATLVTDNRIGLNARFVYATEIIISRTARLPVCQIWAAKTYVLPLV